MAPLLLFMILKDTKSPLQRTHELQAALSPQEYTVVAMPRAMVEAIDSLVMLAKEKASSTKMVETENDWQVIEGIFKVWAASYPDEYKAFANSQTQIHQDLRHGFFNTQGITRERGGAMMQHQLNLPMKFDLMISAIYPNQKLTKKFIKQLSKRFPLLRVPEQL